MFIEAGRKYDITSNSCCQLSDAIPRVYLGQPA